MSLAAGCASAPPKKFFEMPPDALANKAAQTRFFHTDDGDALLSASAAVLQDLGFHVEECAREVGYLRAGKERSARETGQELLRILVAILSFGEHLVPIELQQRIAATLVAAPGGRDPGSYEVRVMFYRVVWSGDGKSGKSYVPPGGQRIELIRDPFVYQQFFAKLSKAVFLEAYTL